jgi:hypothetical protein
MQFLLKSIKKHKMNRILLTIAVCLLISNHSFASDYEYLEAVESDVYQTAGTTQEISNRAKLCMAQILHNDEVRISDATSGTGPLPSLTGAFRETGHSSGISGGNVFVDIDIENGTITANNRVNYSAAFISRNVKSTIVFQAKEGRFKINHSAIEYLQKSTGNLHNSGYMRIAKAWGTGWSDAEEALKVVTDKIATCIKTVQNDNW